MATRVYVAGAERHSGKSAIALATLEMLKGRADRVAVFRPLIPSAEEPDPVLELLLAHATAGLKSEMCVGTTHERFLADPEAGLATIIERFSLVDQHCDAVLALGSDYSDVGAPVELAANGRIAANLAAPVVLVVSGRSGEGAPRSARDVAGSARVAAAQLHQEHCVVAAIVANRVAPEVLEATRDALSASHAGPPAWALPEEPTLSAPLVRTAFKAAEGTLLSGDPAALDRPVMATLVAAMTLEHVLPRLVEGAVVIVPADRSDVLIGAILAHLSPAFPSLSGILLNGGFPLAPPIQRLLDGLGTAVPIATSPLGTVDAALRVTAASGGVAIDSPQRQATTLGLFEANVDTERFAAALSLTTEAVMTPLRFEHALMERARTHRARIVLPEGDDDRVLQAAGVVLQRRIADLTIIGDAPRIRARAAELGVDLGAATLLSPVDAELRDRFAAEYGAMRAHKNMSPESAAETVTDVSYFGTMLVHDGLADGMVSGARHTTASTIRPALEIVKTAPGVSVVSSVFFMALADRVLVYGDCAVIPEPTVEQLADIALSSAATARQFGIEPRVAMLSYSTGDSGAGSDVDRVRAATELVRSRAPSLPIAGPIQYDAAADPEIGAAKMPGSEVAGHATVFVFPDLNTGNNTYKAVQRTTGALAIGPVLQGLSKPINDLSRGATVRDIVNTIAITAVQAREPHRAELPG